jgi:hypothetical protein
MPKKTHALNHTIIITDKTPAAKIADLICGCVESGQHLRFDGPAKEGHVLIFTANPVARPPKPAPVPPPAESEEEAEA